MSILDGIADDLSPFQRAAEIKRRAASLGFDWADVSGLLDHAEDELREIREAVASGDKAKITDEMGDLLFVIANLARFTQTSADDAMQAGITKFETRFRRLEQLLKERNLSPQTADLEALWREVKIISRDAG